MAGATTLPPLMSGLSASFCESYVLVDAPTSRVAGQQHGGARETAALYYCRTRDCCCSPTARHRNGEGSSSPLNASFARRFTLLYMERLYRQGLKFDFFSRIGQGRPGYKQLLQAEPSRDGVPHNDRFWGLMENWLLDVSDPLQDLFNRIFDLSIRRRTSCKDMLAHPWMQMEPASQEAFEAEIRSRPTRVGKDRRMDLSSLGDFDAAWAAVFDACTKYSEECKNDDGNVPVSRQPGEIHVGAEPLLFVARMDYERVLTLHWVSGSLAEWLTFVFCKSSSPPSLVRHWNGPPPLPAPFSCLPTTGSPVAHCQQPVVGPCSASANPPGRGALRETQLGGQPGRCHLGRLAVGGWLSCIGLPVIACSASAVHPLRGVHAFRND